MTARPHLETLTLKAFRGSPVTFKLAFEPNCRLTLIYGENGTGKTTICDAFEFLALEQISSLEDRGMGSSLRKYWPTAGQAADDLVVELETSGGICRGRIAKNAVIIDLGAHKPRLELLRQRQILRLVEAQPGKRYEEVKRFIDIDAFQKSEETLQKHLKTTLEDKAKAVAVEHDSLGALQNAYEVDGSPTARNAVEWARTKVVEPTADLDEKAVKLGQVRTAFEALRAFPDIISAATADTTNTGINLSSAEQALADAKAACDAGEAEKLSVLQAGSYFLHAHGQVDECPLCRSAENAGNLESRLAERLAELSVLSEAAGKWEGAKKALEAARAAEGRARDGLNQGIGNFDLALKAQDWRKEIEVPSSPPPAVPADLTAWLAANAALPDTWRLIEAGWTDQSKFLKTLKAALETYEAKAKEVQKLERLIPNLEAALKICVDARQLFTDGIISEIADEVGRLYEMVHPKEGLNTISIQLDRNKRASLDLEVKAFGLNAPPQAYFSQSHLDTLGLCVFLALAKRQAPASTILILDDVFGSIDEPHVDRIIDMIYSVSADFQHTIVTTHYRRWREKFRWGQLKPGVPCQLVELAQWSITEGMRLGGSLPETERLRAELAKHDPDLQLVCSKAGVILEALLDHLTLKYECAVPRRAGGNYTVGDLLPTINGKLLAALRIEKRDGLPDPKAPPAETIHLKPIFNQLDRIAQARNVMGAHFNAVSFDMLDQDAIAFAREVMALADALIHPKHGWPGSSKSGEYWRNSGDSRRLYPFRKPN